MDPVRWREIERVFAEVCDLADAERAEALARAEPEVRAEVESLLASSERVGDTFRDAIATAASSLASVGATGLVGKRVGPYRLVEVIGEGGMGTVYLAERDDAHYRRGVAIKILRLGIATPQAVARFRDERQILANLDHPSIVRLLDGGETDDGVPYLVMEHCSGVPLTTYARGLAIRARVALVVRVAAALQYAHQELVVHRDIKPSNILVESDGTPKLLDFGIAKWLDPEREARTRSGAALLTLEYASPEQARGEPVTVASDVYSLGAVLYEVLTGRPPQRATGGALELLTSIASVDPPLPSVAAADRRLAGDLDNIAMKALRKEPRRRYASVAEFADDLQRYLDGLPVAARDATWRYRAHKFVGRHRGALAIAGGVAAALIAASIISIRAARRADEQASHAEAQTLALLRERGWQELGSGHVGRALPFLVAALRAGDDSPAVRFSIAEATRGLEQEIARLDEPNGISGVATTDDGARIALTTTGRARIFDARTGTQLVEIHTPGYAYQPAFSHDGRWFLAAAPEGVARVWDAHTGALRYELVHRSMFGHAYPILTLAVTADDALVVAGGLEGRVASWHLATGEPATKLDLGSRDDGCVWALARDGRRIAISCATGAIGVYDLATGARVVELPRSGDVVGLQFGRRDRLFAVGRTTVELWDVARGERIETFASDALLALDPDADHAVTATSGTLALRDAVSGVRLAQLGTAGHAVWLAQFSPDGTRLATGNSDLTFRVWDVQRGEQELLVEGEVGGGTTPHSSGGMIGTGFLGDRAHLWTASARGAVLWELARTPLVAEHAVGGGLARALAVSADDGLAVVVGDGNLTWWDLQAGRLVRRVPTTESLQDVQWSRGRVVAVGTHGTARIYGADGQVVRALAGSAATVNRASWSPDGARIAAACDDRAVRVWDAGTGALLATLPHPDRVLSAAWDRAGARLATAGWDGAVRVWDATGYALVATFPTTGQMLDVAFSPDGTRLAAGDHGGEASVWDVATGARELSLVGHAGPIASVAWSSDGGLLATSSSDGTVRIWDGRGGTQLAVRRGSGEIMQVVWSHDAARLFAISSDQTLRVWDARRDERSADELEALLARRVPYRLVDGRLEHAPSR